MTRAEMDKLNVGDKVEVKTYNTTTGKYEWIPTIVSRVLVCSDGGKFAHGGYHSVSAKVNGFTETLDNEFTRLYTCKEKMQIKLNNGLTLRIFEPRSFLSDNAFVYYSNSDYKIAIDEKSKSYNRYYVLLNNYIACGPTDRVEIEEFFNDCIKYL